MKTNKYYALIWIGVLALLFSSCGTVKDAFDPQRKNSSEEFLVEKKSPLSMPPEYGKLPVPQNSIEEEQNQSKDIELLISKDIIDENKKEQTSNSDEDFLKLLLDKIKNN